MSNSPSSKALLVTAMTAALGVGALAYYVKFEPGVAHIPAALKSAPKQPMPEVETPTKGAGQVTQQDSGDDGSQVSLPKISGNNAHLDTEQTDVPDGQDQYKFVAEHCLEEAGVHDVKVLGVDIRRRIAIINFDSGIDAGMGGTQEGQFLKAIQVAFGQFKSVDKVELQKENQPLSSLGEIELDGPMPVIRSGNSEDAPTSSKPNEP